MFHLHPPPPTSTPLNSQWTRLRWLKLREKEKTAAATTIESICLIVSISTARKPAARTQMISHRQQSKIKSNGAESMNKFDNAAMETQNDNNNNNNRQNHRNEKMRRPTPQSPTPAPSGGQMDATHATAL